MVRKLYSALLLLVFCTSGCSEKRETSGLKVLTDDLGREVHVDTAISKVMSLSASLTEMLYVICDDSQIVARTPHCNYPLEVLKKPIINNYPIDYERLLMLKPDLVFTKEGIISLEEANKVEEMGIPVYFQRYKNTEDIFTGLEKLGKLLGKEEKARKAADSLRLLLNTIQTSIKGRPRPSVLMIISKDKIFVYGKDTYASDMLEKAGGRNAVDSIFQLAYPALTSEYILHLDPDIILGSEYADLQGGFFNTYPELKKTKAYQNKKIYTVPEELISRPGPRVVEGIRLIKQIIHPDA